MAWSAWYTSFSDAFKKRAGRYLINKYLGTFLDETVSLDQLSVDGDISLSNVALNIRLIFYSLALHDALKLRRPLF